MRYQTHGRSGVRRLQGWACTTRLVIDGWSSTGWTGDGEVAYVHVAGFTAQPIMGGLLLSVFDEHRQFLGTVGNVRELP